MSFLVNPFRKNDLTECPEVLISLAEAPELQPRRSNEHKEPDAKPAEVGAVASSHFATTLTLETLRAEVEGDPDALGHDTAYDRTSYAY